MEGIITRAHARQSSHKLPQHNTRETHWSMEEGGVGLCLCCLVLPAPLQQRGQREKLQYGANKGARRGIAECWRAQG